MWFSMPMGCSSISIERQQFVPEIVDEDGLPYFRAPEHFAPRILMLSGFAIAEPPEGAPEDLPRSDPLRDGAIAQLTTQAEADKREIQDLRSDLQSAVARITALMNENGELQKAKTAAESKVAALEEELEDKPAVAVAPKAK